MGKKAEIKTDIEKAVEAVRFAFNSGAEIDIRFRHLSYAEALIVMGDISAITGKEFIEENHQNVKWLELVVQETDIVRIAAFYEEAGQ